MRHEASTIDNRLINELSDYIFQVLGIIQSFKFSKFRSFKIPRFQDSKVSKFQSFKASRFQDSKMPRFQDSKFSKFTQSICQDCRKYSIIPKESNSQIPIFQIIFSKNGSGHFLGFVQVSWYIHIHK